MLVPPASGTRRTNRSDPPHRRTFIEGQTETLCSRCFSTARIQRHDVLPAFTLKDQDGVARGLDGYHGRNVVLVFYDRDRDPASVQEVTAFRDALDRFRALHTDIIGVSADPPRRHRAFARQHSIPFPLLSDRRHRLARRFGVWDEENRRVPHATVVIDRDGRVARIYEGSRPDRHAEQVLQHLTVLDHAEDWSPGPTVPLLA